MGCWQDVWLDVALDVAKKKSAQKNWVKNGQHPTSWDVELETLDVTSATSALIHIPVYIHIRHVLARSGVFGLMVVR